MDQEAAVAELQRSAGTQFDPAIVEHFYQALSSHREATLRAA